MCAQLEAKPADNRTLPWLDRIRNDAATSTFSTAANTHTGNQQRPILFSQFPRNNRPVQRPKKKRDANETNRSKRKRTCSKDVAGLGTRVRNDETPKWKQERRRNDGCKQTGPTRGRERANHLVLSEDEREKEKRRSLSNP